MTDKIKTPEEAAKEKKQLIFLGCMMAFAALYFGFTGLIQPKFAEISELQTKVADAQTHYNLVESTLKGAKTVHALSYDTFSKINYLSENVFPPEKNPLVWIIQLVGDVSQECGVPAEMRSYKPKSAKPFLSVGKEIYLEDYEFEVQVTSDTHTFGRFVGEIERRIPFCYVTNIGITSSTGKNVSGYINCVVPRLNGKGRSELKKMVDLFVKGAKK